MLLRNTRYFGVKLPFDPPLDAQLLYAHLLTNTPARQVGLHAAMEALGIEAGAARAPGGVRRAVHGAGAAEDSRGL